MLHNLLWIGTLVTLSYCFTRIEHILSDIPGCCKRFENSVLHVISLFRSGFLQIACSLIRTGKARTALCERKAGGGVLAAPAKRAQRKVKRSFFMTTVLAETVTVRKASVLLRQATEWEWKSVLPIAGKQKNHLCVLQIAYYERITGKKVPIRLPTHPK